jgi:hypothetical protein
MEDQGAAQMQIFLLVAYPRQGLDGSEIAGKAMAK